MVDPEGPLWIQVVDPENGEESSEGGMKDNAENEHNNAHKQKNDEDDDLEPPSPSKPAYENTACLQKKRIESFSWGDSDKIDFNKFIDTAIKVKERRNLLVSDLEKKFLYKIYNNGI